MLQENCYVISDDTKECVICDCGAYSQHERQSIIDYIKEQQLKPVHLIPHMAILIIISVIILFMSNTV